MTIDRFKEFVGETEAEAVEKASTHFGVDPDQLEVHVVSERLEVSGLAGRALVIAAGPGGAPEREVRGGRRDRGRPERDRGRSGRSGREERGNGRGGRDARGARDARGPRERREPREPREAREQGPLELETGELGEVGRFVERVVRGIARGGKVRIEESEAEDEVQITIKGPGADELAQTPGLGAALSHLADRVAQNRLGEDAAAYVELGERGERERGARGGDEPSDPRLEALARERAEAVRESGEPVVLDPMDSRERFIVHNAVKEIAGVSSESVGEGREKRVKIFKVSS